MKRFNVAGWTACGAFAQAKAVTSGLSALFPSKLQVTIHEYASRDEYMAWLEANRDALGSATHRTSPFVWFEGGTYLGGRDDTIGK